MRALKYAILGLLNRRPMTGYELSKEFNFELAEFWYANHSQIYPELKKLHTEGLVTYDVEISGDILETKRYTITEQGQKDFMQWLHKDEKLQRTPKNPFRLRMYFSNYLDTETRVQMLENQKMQHVKRLNALKKTCEQYPETPPKDSDRFGDFLVLRGAITREEQVLAWLDECIGYCKE
ncbi:MAG: PadR family transcriptional regulator [Clostridia bacterium]|nr:PadR family transcriptional regulator [Clostridia bacterium]